MLNGHGVLIWEHGKSSGDGGWRRVHNHVTVLNPLNYTLKGDEGDIFVCTFYHNTKAEWMNEFGIMLPILLLRDIKLNSKKKWRNILP